MSSQRASRFGEFLRSQGHWKIIETSGPASPPTKRTEAAPATATASAASASRDAHATPTGSIASSHLLRVLQAGRPEPAPTMAERVAVSIASVPELPAQLRVRAKRGDHDVDVCP